MTNATGMLIGMGDLFSESWGLFKKVFLKLVLIALIGIVLMGAFSLSAFGLGWVLLKLLPALKADQV